MLSYDAPMPANKGQKDAPAPATLTTSDVAAAAASIPSATMNGLARNGTYKHHHIWLVTGPAGCGKTTVASHLSKALNMPYIEGDSFHPPANIEKMANGTPLTDADRWDWLAALREESMRRINGGSEGVVLTCSALKRKYRDVIRVAAYYDTNLLIHFIYLDADEAVILDRVTKRQGHYMGANMVHSQFETLERPSANERDVVSIDVSVSMDAVKVDALNQVRKLMLNDLDDGSG